MVKFKVFFVGSILPGSILAGSMLVSSAMLGSAALGAQEAGASQQSVPAGPMVQGPAVTVSGLLQPALASVQATLAALKLEKWKKGSVRDEAGENVTSLQHDLENNMPPLVATADASPGSLSKTIPLVKHLDALYDVLLRVEEASRVSAPGEQVAELQQALVKLSAARISLDDQMQSQAAMQEKQVADLQAESKAQQQTAQTVKAAEPAPCKPAAAVRKRKKAATPGKAGPAAAAPGAAPAAPKAK